MLPLLKKKSDADAAPAVPAWHPNFRNYQKLPDIKVVRTAFFVNGIAILLVVAISFLPIAIELWKARREKRSLALDMAHDLVDPGLLEVTREAIDPDGRLD